MIKFIVVVLACIGAFFGLAILSGHVPQISHTAFNISTFQVTWLMLGVCATGFVSYKVCK
jgi:hypothetical protein